MITNTLKGVYEFGADALANIFEFTLDKAPIGLTKDSFQKGTGDKLSIFESITARIHDVSLPEIVQTPYSVHYKTGEVTRASGKHGSPKQFTFNVRVDKNFNLYSFFNAWGNLPNATGNKMQLASPKNYTVESIQLSRVKYDDLTKVTEEKNKAFEFSKCWVSNVAGLTFDNANGEPLVVSITMQFAYMELLDGKVKIEVKDKA